VPCPQNSWHRYRSQLQRVGDRLKTLLDHLLRADKIDPEFVVLQKNAAPRSDGNADWKTSSICGRGDTLHLGPKSGTIPGRRKNQSDRGARAGNLRRSHERSLSDSTCRCGKNLSARDIIGFRNILAHGYAELDHNNVYNIALIDAPALLLTRTAPKTNEDRTVELSLRALAILKRQFALRNQYEQAGKINHDVVFFRDRRQSHAQPHARLPALALRHREPESPLPRALQRPPLLRKLAPDARKNLLWCARQHAHSAQVMLGMYGAWIEGSTDEDIAAIKRSMEAGPTAEVIHGITLPAVPANPLPGATKVPPTGGWGRLSWRKIKKNNGGADGRREALQVVEKKTLSCGIAANCPPKCPHVTSALVRLQQISVDFTETSRERLDDCVRDFTAATSGGASRRATIRLSIGVTELRLQCSKPPAQNC
jgi:hypothetical protein